MEVLTEKKIQHYNFTKYITKHIYSYNLLFKDKLEKKMMVNYINK